MTRIRSHGCEGHRWLLRTRGGPGVCRQRRAASRAGGRGRHPAGLGQLLTCQGRTRVLAPNPPNHATNKTQRRCGAAAARPRQWISPSSPQMRRRRGAPPVLRGEGAAPSTCCCELLRAPGGGRGRVPAASYAPEPRRPGAWPCLPRYRHRRTPGAERAQSAEQKDRGPAPTAGVCLSQVWRPKAKVGCWRVCCRELGGASSFRQALLTAASGGRRGEGSLGESLIEGHRSRPGAPP